MEEIINIRTPNTGLKDPVMRETQTLYPYQLNNHYIFSPDAKWISTAAAALDNLSDPDYREFIVAYPVQASSTPIKIARFTYNLSSLTSSSDPGFSPDGTKNIFYGNVRNEKQSRHLHSCV